MVICNPTNKEKTTTTYKYNDDRDLIEQTVVKEIELPSPFNFSSHTETACNDCCDDELEECDGVAIDGRIIDLSAALAGVVIGMLIGKLFRK